MDEAKLNEALAQVLAESLRADTAEQSLSEATTKIAELEGKLRGAENQIAGLDAQVAARADANTEKLQSENQKLKSQLQAALKARADALSPERLNAAVKARVDLERRAAVVLGEDQRFDTMTDREIMVRVIERLDGQVEDKQPDAYVIGCFNTLTKGHAKGAAGLARVREAIESRASVNAERTDNKSARELFLERMNNAWKEGK